jgi:ubiquinone/menaquinone biosynthesis C-methylase UbiE
LRRIPEPELMNDAQQAEEYAAADFEEPNARFLALLNERLAPLSERGVALDLGCGPGDIALRFARLHPHWEIDGVDGSEPMLAIARTAAADADLHGRVSFNLAHLPTPALPRASYDLILSNSLLHHLAEPDALWSAIRRLGCPGAGVLVMDLLRPDSRDEAMRLVDRYAGEEPEGLRKDFHHSLRAAYRPDEVLAQLEDAGLGLLTLEVVSDRHFVVWGTLAP